jgi:uncharacterized protein
MEITDLLKETRLRHPANRRVSQPKNIRIFGSAARGAAGESSDIDFLVELEDGRCLLDLASLLADLRDLLGCRVDVVSEKGLYWLLLLRILKEARAL